jgi:hypothetical protein
MTETKTAANWLFARVGVGRQPVVAVGDDAVVLLACILNRVNVDHSHVKIVQLMHETMVDLSGNVVSPLDRERRVNRNVDLCSQPVSQPPSPHLGHVLDALNASCGVTDLPYQRRVHPVQEAREHHLTRLPHDHQNRPRDQEADDRVGEWVSEPHPEGPEQHG